MSVEPASGPLRGVRVIDLTRVLAGPFGTQILADLGAEVIKVEQPGAGDDTRTIPPLYPGGESHYFMSLNRNKRGLAVDLKAAEGRRFFLDLVATADVVIENFRPGVMDRLGLGFKDLVRARADIILCSISGYGQEGPLRAAPAFDLVIQALSGSMSVNGEPDGPPTKLGLPMADLGGALWGAIGILACLAGRAGGDRQPHHLDISLLDGLISLQGYLNQLALMSGQSPGRIGSNHHNVVPYGRYQASDGYLVLAPLSSSFWDRLCAAVGRPQLAQDPLFATPADRRANREELQEILDAALGERSREEWAAIFEAADIPTAPVLDVSEALAHEQVRSRGLVRSFLHPEEGEVQVVGPPIRLDGRSTSARLTPPPGLGEHSREIARELGLGEEAIADLVGRGILASAPASSRSV